jgi:hypothetical protein
MTFPRKLLVHGKMLRLVEEEGGGAGVIRMNVDSYLDRGGEKKAAESSVEVTFFFPNYDPTLLKSGDLMWVHLELYADWEDLKEMPTRETWIRSLNGNHTGYRYALAGEMFQLLEPGRDDDLYLNAGFPVSLTLGLPSYPGKRPSIQRSQYVIITRGTLYGHVELHDPEYGPVPAKKDSLHITEG